MTKKRDIIHTKFGVNLPSVIQIGGAVYRIKDAKLRGKRKMAELDYRTQVMSIDVAKHANLNDLLDTYNHEVSHIITAEFRTKVSHDDIRRDTHGRTQALLALVNAQ